MKKKIYLGGRMSGKSFFDDEKELTPREAWEEIKKQIGSATYIRSDLGAPQITTMLVRDTGLFEIIDCALDRLEFLDNDSLFIFFSGGREVGKTAFTMSICKKLKALEIIKNKCLCVDEKYGTINIKNFNVLTQEEYNLLKEVFVDDSRTTKTEAR